MALPKQQENFPEWYQAVIKEAELAENSLARGTMVIKPWGYAIWERIQAAFDERIKATGHENVYFPMFIPERLLHKEAEHVEGFAPEVAVVTHGGGEELEEPLVIRPTSETIIWEAYSRWIQSWRDLPVLYNQWANVVRWEKRPRLFLRTSEFLWQEGHTAHETADDAMAEALRVLHEIYIDATTKVLRIPIIAGRKTEAERFPGAEETFAMEAMMRDGKALQAGTSHYLGQNFAKAYGVQFQSREGELEYPYATSWGVSTRLVGGLIMTHGDDRGLRLPPALAPKQIIIVPIYSTEEKTTVLAAADKLVKELSEFRVKVDDRDDQRPGYKFAEWEVKGVPVRIEIGPRDIASNHVVVTRRDTSEKQPVPMDKLAAHVRELMGLIDQTLYDQAETFRNEHTLRPKSYDEMREFLSKSQGFVVAPWDGTAQTEAQVKQETKATIRCLPLDQESVEGQHCIVSGEPAQQWALWAQAY